MRREQGGVTAGVRGTCVVGGGAHGRTLTMASARGTSPGRGYPGGVV
jgi:hypothetical protein